MALAHSPKIVKDGLVFAYDMGNPAKSWKGAPATNLITETNLNNWSKTAITSAYDLKTPFKAQAYAITDNNTGSYLSISRNITVANDSSSYTTSLFVKKTTGATSARLGFNIGFNTGGTTVSVNARFNSDTGVATTGTVVSQGDWWYWYFTISNNGTGNTNLTCAFYPATGLYNSSDNVVGVGTAIIGELMIVAGSVPARFVSGTRSNTQALLDLTRNNTITANSLTYNADGSFSFDGSNNFASFGNGSTISSIGGTSNITVEAWLKYDSYVGSGGSRTYSVVTHKGTPWTWLMENPSNRGRIRFTIGGADVSCADPDVHPLSTWMNWVGTYDGANMKFYRNGVLKNTVASTGTLGSNSVSAAIGEYNNDYRMDGDVSIVKIYNRALTATEVLQNFNALRGRYGL